ncbi:MAG: zinc-dependent alcohol dehydrogenase [Candidatus Obscuribacterales bacterium]
MKAATWHGTKDIRVEEVAEPQILAPTDAILEVTASAICGSDLHIYDGFVPTMEKGDILGHEFAGRVVEVGSAVQKVRVGDRVVVPFTISCGQCSFCSNQMFALCDRTNPNAEMQEKLIGHGTAGLFGYSHMYGGFPGGQAQFVRVPYVDVGAVVIPESMSDEQVLFLSDIFPTGYMAAENCNIQPGQTVAVWGCGPVGQFAIRSAFMLGAERVIAIDELPERLEMARKAGAETIDFAAEDIGDALKQMTNGLGPDACIDAVGMEASGHTVDAVLDKAMQAVKLETDRPHVLREIFKVCRNGGTVSIPGVYVGVVQNFPIGIAFAKGLSLKMGQTHVQRYMPMLLERIQSGEIDPSFVITHKIGMDDIPEAYKTFVKKQQGAIKFFITPQAA